MAAISTGGPNRLHSSRSEIDKFESFIPISQPPKGIPMFLKGKPFSGMSQNSLQNREKTVRWAL